MADDPKFENVLRDLTESVYGGNIRKAAGKSGISRTTYYDLMDGISNPSLETLDKLAAGFGESAAVLYYAAGVAVPPKYHPTLLRLAERMGEDPETLYERAVAELAERVQ